MRQIFFITDDRLMAMLWQGMQLVSKYEFQSNEDSVALFKEYLQESKNIECQVIVDILEEEITLTNIPHVGPHERKFLVDRACTRLHRSTEFSYARIIDREKTKRRDDRLLVSGLTNDRILVKWLDVISAAGVRLKGVYSLPLISGNVLNLVGMKKGLTLMVSRQSRGFIRQSIFKDGKLFYSRNIPSSLNFSIEKIVSDLEKTRKYLQNQKLLTLDDSIDVVVLASDRFYQQLSGLDSMLPDMNLVYIKHEGLQKSLGINSSYRVGGREIFSALLQKTIIENHYGRAQDLAVYKTHRKNSVLNYASIAAAVIFSVVSAKYYLDIKLLDKNLHGIEDQITSLKVQNNKLAENINRLPLKAKQMKLFVDNMEEIDRASKSGVEKAFIQLSQIFNAYQSVTLKNIGWYINSANYKKAAISSRGRSRNKKSVTKISHEQMIEITAAIDLSAMGNQQAMKTIDRFIESVKRIRSVTNVSLIKAPLKSSSDEKIDGVMSEKLSARKSEFALTVLIEGDGHAG